MLGGPGMSLHSRRLSWETQLHFDNPTYISTHYGQVSLAWWCQPQLPGQGPSKTPCPQRRRGWQQWV